MLLQSGETDYYITLHCMDSVALQSDLNCLVSWSEKWQMNFNIKKCYKMHMTRQRKHKTTHTYNMKGFALSTVTSHPYLGVEIQSDLRWNDQINKINNKSSKL